MQHKFCPECGTKAPSITAKFCSSCGSSLNPLAQKKTITRQPIVAASEGGEDETDVYEIPQLDKLQAQVEGFGGINTSEGVFGGANSFVFTPNGFANARLNTIRK